MNKVYQRFIDNKRGDCMQAAIATLLGITYEETPAFIQHKDGYFPPLFKLITEKGYVWNGMLHNHIDKTNMLDEYGVWQLKNYRGVNGLWYASVYSPKYFIEGTEGSAIACTHAVLVDSNLNIVHDPNPEYKGIKQYPLADKLGYNGILSVTLIEPPKEK